MKPGGAPGGVFKIADGWMSMLAINDRDWREPVHGDGDAGAGRRIPASPRRPCGSPTRLPLYAIVRPAHCRRAVGRVEQAPHRSAA